MVTLIGQLLHAHAVA